MKHRAQGFILGMLFSALGIYGMSRLGDTIERGKCPAALSSILATANVVERHLESHGGYPAALTMDELAGIVDPDEARYLPERQVEYYSDGLSYVIVGHGWPAGCQYVVRNGEFVLWPQHLGQERPKSVPR